MIVFHFRETRFHRNVFYPAIVYKRPRSNLDFLKSNFLCGCVFKYKTISPLCARLISPCTVFISKKVCRSALHSLAMGQI